eukprot:12441380-Alexandrium_andersonii.AAC.1
MPSILEKLIVRFVLRLTICPPAAWKRASFPPMASALAASSGRTWNARRHLCFSFEMSPGFTSPRFGTRPPSAAR